VLGNPAQAVEALKTGVYDLLVRPVQQQLQSPGSGSGSARGLMGFGWDVGRGAISFIGNTLEASARVIGDITGSIERGVVFVTRDSADEATRLGVLLPEADAVIVSSGLEHEVHRFIDRAEAAATSAHRNAISSPTPAQRAQSVATAMLSPVWLTAHVFRRAADFVALSGRYMSLRTDNTGVAPKRQTPRLRWGIDRRLLPLSSLSGVDLTSPGSGEQALLTAALAQALIDDRSRGTPAELCDAAFAVAAASYMHHMLWPRLQVRLELQNGVPSFVYEPERVCCGGVGGSVQLSTAPPLDSPVAPSLMLIISTRVIMLLPWRQQQKIPGSASPQVRRNSQSTSPSELCKTLPPEFFSPEPPSPSSPLATHRPDDTVHCTAAESSYAVLRPPEGQLR
jgi:hypothetical protein